jgi:hypothetical protein
MIGQALSWNVTEKLYADNGTAGTVQFTDKFIGFEPVVVTIAPGKLDVMVFTAVRMSVALRSDAEILKETFLPGQVENVFPFNVAPETAVGVLATGGLFEQLITTICISRITLPIKTPLRYSSTLTATATICGPFGVKVICPVAGSNIKAPTIFIGLVTVYPALYVSGVPAAFKGVIIV